MIGSPIGPSDPRELPVSIAPPELVARAAALVNTYSECFWFWRAGAPIRTVDDIRLVIEHLRQYGGHRAWVDAQDLHRCLLPLSKRTS